MENKQNKNWIMVTACLVFVLILMFTLSCCSDERESANKSNLFQNGLLLVSNGELYGYADVNGNCVIPFLYEQAEQFSEGVALIKKDGLYGYINAKGEYVIEPRFSVAYSFSEGLAWTLTENGERGFINKTGEMAISTENAYSEMFSEGLACFFDISNKKNNGYINTKGECVIEVDGVPQSFHNGYAIVCSEMGYGFIDKTGNFIVEPQYEEVENFSEGLAMVKKDGLYGYINTKGEYVVEPQYDFALSFSEGLAAAQKNGEWSYIDTNGRCVIKLKCDIAYPFYNGVAMILKNDKNSYINKDGEYITDIWFETGYSFSNGLAQVLIDGRYGYINTDCEIVIEPIYLRAGTFDKDGYAIVRNEDKKAILIDRNGNELFKKGFDSAGSHYYEMCKENDCCTIVYGDEGYCFTHSNTKED